MMKKNRYLSSFIVFICMSCFQISIAMLQKSQPHLIILQNSRLLANLNIISALEPQVSITHTIGHQLQPWGFPDVRQQASFIEKITKIRENTNAKIIIYAQEDRAPACLTWIANHFQDQKFIEAIILDTPILSSKNFPISPVMPNINPQVPIVVLCPKTAPSTHESNLFYGFARARNRDLLTGSFSSFLLNSKEESNIITSIIENRTSDQIYRPALNELSYRYMENTVETEAKLCTEYVLKNLLFFATLSFVAYKLCRYFFQ